MKIGVDLISGESPIEELIDGCLDAALLYNEKDDVEIVMIGKEKVYREILENKKKRLKKKKIFERISIMDAEEIITMDDEPINAIKNKKEASIVKGLKAHKEGSLDAFFSPGNTGALVLGSSLILGRIRGVKKPALVTIFPNAEGKPTVLLDVGASAECEADDYVNFAAMGRIYSEEMLNVDNPNVGLLNIGKEEHKGPAALKSAYKKLYDLRDMNFIGNVEGHQILSGEVDVVVCDGSMGNIALKTIEGSARAFSKFLKKAIKKSLPAIVSLPFYSSALNELRGILDPEKYGAVPLLGIRGIIYKGHGSSGRDAIKYGIKACVEAVRHDIAGKINRRIEEIKIKLGNNN